MYHNQKKYDLAERYYLLAIENNTINIDYINNLVAIYETQSRFDKVLSFYTKYKININPLIKKILENQIKLDDDVIRLLQNFDINNEYDIEFKYYDTISRYKFEIFNKLNIIPKNIDSATYKTYKIVFNEILPKLQFSKSVTGNSGIPGKFPNPNLYKNIILCICRKIFD